MTTRAIDVALGLTLWLAAAVGSAAETKTHHNLKKPKFLFGEATITQGQTKVDFEEAQIGGERKEALGTMVRDSTYDPNHDFIRVRLHWRPEMAWSTRVLATD